MYAFVVLGLVFPFQDNRLGMSVKCVKQDVKPQLNQCMKFSGKVGNGPVNN